ncbi:MAG: hypothetical protein PHU95_01180 [Candidatus Thermoplasmatota archaeon]|nr:hypothetical protein [Candidatus Thermoplasmatota archaeon]MDD5778048.1 hypothetical protein [Candidatus Thermoplasmatota archaeon]
MPVTEPIILNRLPPVARCDLCLCRFAMWWSEQDGTRLCEHCVGQYMKEHGLGHQQVAGVP